MKALKGSKEEKCSKKIILILNEKEVTGKKKTGR